MESNTERAEALMRYCFELDVDGRLARRSRALISRSGKNPAFLEEQDLGSLKKVSGQLGREVGKQWEQLCSSTRLPRAYTMVAPPGYPCFSKLPNQRSPAARAALPGVDSSVEREASVGVDCDQMVCP